MMTRIDPKKKDGSSAYSRRRCICYGYDICTIIHWWESSGHHVMLDKNRRMSIDLGYTYNNGTGCGRRLERLYS